MQLFIMFIIISIVVMALVVGLIGIWFMLKSRKLFSDDNEADRIGKPELMQINLKYGLNLPESLAEFYKSDVVRKREFEFVDLKCKGNPVGWFINAFIPLTVQDVSKWKEISPQVRGIPIATTDDPAIYFIDTEPEQSNQYPICRTERGENGWEVRRVAESIAEFICFKVLEDGTTAQPGAPPDANRGHR